MLKVAIPAKINLHLQVLGRRPDGFHELRTLFQSIDLFDNLVGESADGVDLELTVDPTDAVSSGPDNLVMRAATLLRQKSGIRCGARLRLHKRIPVGGGLGGGSADAAAALVLLNALWSLDLTVVELADLAGELGSDVPFFLHGGLALGVGRGEEIYPLDDLVAPAGGPLGVLVAVPAEQVPTAEVFARLDRQLTWTRHEASVYALAAGLSSRPCWGRMENDLERIVCVGWPAVAAVVERLRGLGALRAAVTGSGAASFALFSGVEEARAAAVGLDRSWRTHVGVVLSRERARPSVEVRSADSEDGPRGN